MKNLKATLILLISVVILGTGMNAFGFLGFGNSASWKEEVLLHDGRKIIVERTTVRGGRHEPGQKSPYKEQSLSFTMPGTGQEVTWEDKFSKDLGMANFLPMLLDVLNGAAYLVVSPMGCLSYNKWGRPNPPYVIFNYDGKAWQRIPLEDLPAEIKTPNLVFSSPDVEVESVSTRFMTAEKIKAIISGYPQPEYKTILRESLDEKGIACTEMIRVDDGWVGIEWFTSQPTYDQCLSICKIKKLTSEQCPCARIFNKNNKEK